LEGATAAGMGTADMGRIVSDALRAFGKEADQTTDIMDVLVKGSTSANTSVSELGKGISIVGGIAREAGMGIESVVATMGSMQNAGVGASRAAVAMRAGISRLLKPTGDAQTTLRQLGVSAKDAQGNFRGLIPVLSDLEAAGASSSDMLSVFGRRAGPTLQTALSNGVGAIKKFRGELQNADGTTREISNFIEGTLVEQLSVLWGSIETLGATIGSALTPVLKPLVQLLKGVVNGLMLFIKAGEQLANFLAGDFVDSHQEAKDSASDVDDEEKKLTASVKSATGAADSMV